MALHQPRRRLSPLPDYRYSVLDAPDANVTVACTTRDNDVFGQLYDIGWTYDPLGAAWGPGQPGLVRALQLWAVGAHQCGDLLPVRPVRKVSCCEPPVHFVVASAAIQNSVYSLRLENSFLPQKFCARIELTVVLCER